MWYNLKLDSRIFTLLNGESHFIRLESGKLGKPFEKMVLEFFADDWIARVDPRISPFAENCLLVRINNGVVLVICLHDAIVALEDEIPPLASRDLKVGWIIWQWIHHCLHVASLAFGIYTLSVELEHVMVIVVKIAPNKVGIVEWDVLAASNFIPLS